MIRDCRCPRSHHEHGTYLAYVNDDCRCEPCRTAWRIYSRAQKVRKARAQWGITEQRPYDMVPAIGTVRRLRALAVIGYGTPQLAERLGIYDGDLRSIRAGVWACARRSTADAVAALYDELWGTPSTAYRAAWVRSRAAASGWVPPLAWDDDTIDDPDAEPYRATWHTDRADPRIVDEIAIGEAMRGRPVKLNRHERRIAAQRLTEQGWSAARIADVLGTTQRTVQRRRAAA